MDGRMDGRWTRKNGRSRRSGGTSRLVDDAACIVCFLVVVLGRALASGPADTSTTDVSCISCSSNRSTAARRIVLETGPHDRTPCLKLVYSTLLLWAAPRKGDTAVPVDSPRCGEIGYGEI